MPTTEHADLLVIGSGPGGAKAALLAAQSGLKTVLAEAGFPGGTCLNSGCIPTKFLLGATEALPLLAAQRRLGLIRREARRETRGEALLDFAALQERKKNYLKSAREELEAELAKAGVIPRRGRASFTGPREARIKGSDGDRLISFDKAVVATGSIPASFPGLKPDGATVLAASSALNLEQPPESLIVVGGGAIGLELGEIFHRFGTKIILVEAAPRILSGEDPDVGDIVRAHCAEQGWTIVEGRKILSLATEEGRSLLRFEDGEPLSAAASLLGIGRRPATAGLDPEAAGLRLTERGWLDTDNHLRCAGHIYAVGDINGRVLLSNAADHQARYVVGHLRGEISAPYAPPSIPACIYGSCEIMRVGPTLAELERRGRAPRVSRAPLAASVLAQSCGQTRGFVKMLWDEGRLVSVAAVGHGVSRLLAAASFLVEEKIEKKSGCPILLAHPALDEVLESAILASLEGNV